MIKKNSILILLLCAAAIGVLYFIKDGTMVVPGGVTHSIKMNEEGFSPSEISVKKGDRVIFSNMSTSTSRWPASDLHPTHELYREFDPQQPVVPGESWSFVFTKTGQWRFHDHLHPNKRGVIRVESTVSP